jgi:hypothetical protein
MGLRSTILTRLPANVRAELEKRLAEPGVRIAELLRWLHGLGYRISRSALNAYRRNLEGRGEIVTAATERALGPFGKDGITTEALLRLIEQRLLSLLTETARPRGQNELRRLADIISEVTGTIIRHRRWLAEQHDASRNLGTPPPARCRRALADFPPPRGASATSSR